MSRNRKNLVYLLNGSIGDFLMVLSVFDSLRDKDMRLFISTPRNHELFNSLIELYPNISIIRYPWDLFRFFFSQNIVITPPTPGILPWHQKLLGWFITRMPKSKFFGFQDKQTTTSFLYTGLVPYRTDILFIDLLYSVIEKIGLSFTRNIPSLRRDFGDSTINSPYIVFHPFGASLGRSFTGEKLETIIQKLSTLFPNHTIVMTGGKDDSNHINFLLPSNVIVCFGKSIKELADIIFYADCFVGVDTGITHLANMLQKKTLVFAEQGTTHWLPYYNEKATIVYQIQGDTSGVYEGRDYLFGKANGRVRYLDRIPIAVIIDYLERLSHEI